MTNNLATIGIFVASFFLSSIAGIANFLKSGKDTKKISLLTAFLNSGMLGLAISFLGYQKFKDNIPMLLGLSTISGLMGSVGNEIILSLISKGGIKIDISSLDKKDAEDKAKEDK